MISIKCLKALRAKIPPNGTLDLTTAESNALIDALTELIYRRAKED